jgi:hypothetical protein
MFKDQNQEQKAGDKSTNLQAQNITVNQGISYQDAKEIATDVFKNNFLHLSQKALITAEERAQELIENFLERINLEKPNAINSVESPSMQHALFSAQKEYAKTGDRDLSEILVDLLVERSDKEERTLLQIVLDESIEVASKLTQPQFDVLTLVFILKYSMNHSLGNLEKFDNYIRTYIVPFCNNLTQENSCYQHLEYANCSSTLLGSNLGEVLTNNYVGLFQKGTPKEELDNLFGDYSSDLVVNCLQNKELFQIKSLNLDQLEKQLSNIGIPQEIKNQISAKFKSNIFSVVEVENYVEKIDEKMGNFIKIWNETMSSINLTSVGMALGRANFKRKTGINLDLSIWIK